MPKVSIYFFLLSFSSSSSLSPTSFSFFPCSIFLCPPPHLPSQFFSFLHPITSSFFCLTPLHPPLPSFPLLSLAVTS